jgi:hypothetical protein
MFPAVLIGALLLLSRPFGLSGPESYDCIVMEQLFLQDSAALERPPIPYLLGKRFTVDRNTGAVNGEGSASWFFSAHETRILTGGNEHSSFVLTNVAPAREGGVHHTVLSVKEFHRATLRPFIVLDGLQVVSGVCA